MDEKIADNTYKKYLEEKGWEPEFRYQLLSSMRYDCIYFLGYGNFCSKFLWAGSVADQIGYIERDFALAKELHGFRYTQEYGQARMAWKAAFTFACINLKKLAKMTWNNPKIPHISCAFVRYLHNFISLIKTPPAFPPAGGDCLRSVQYKEFCIASGCWSTSKHASFVSFDRYCVKHARNEKCLSQEMADGWCEKKPTEIANSCRSRIYPVIGLLQYMIERGLTEINLLK